jgi:2-polyprenyl-3-methyl-5-hydroxy-6-metoxy-1,4-benzoquinol methylase
MNDSHQPIDWKSYYNREHEIWRFVPEFDPTEEHRLAFVRSLFPPGPLSSILDAGCGDGHQCNTFAAKASRVVGVDVALPRLQFAKEHRAASHIHFASCDLMNLPFKPRTFDLVTLVEVLEHMPNPLAILKNLSALTRGYLLVTVPYKQKPLIVMCPHCLKNFPVDGHLQIFDEQSLQAVLREAGLHILKIKQYFHPSPWERVPPICLLPPAGKRFVRRLLQSSSLITRNNATFIGALCEVP